MQGTAEADFQVAMQLEGVGGVVFPRITLVLPGKVAAAPAVRAH